MTGRCDARPELVGQQIPLEVHVPALPTRGGPDLVERLFAPLGWSVTTTAIELDDRSHESAERIEADIKKSRAASAAGIRLIRWNVKGLPDDGEIRHAFESR